MPLRIPRLRRWFAGGAILVVLLVAGAYFYAKWRVSNALQEVPEKIGINIEQTAQGFTVSRSAAGRTIFKVQANRAVKFKEGARAELHDVMINGPTPSKLTADHGTIIKNPKQVLLQHLHLQSRDKQLDADKATLFLRPDNVLDRVLASGNVLVQSETDPITRIRAAQLDALMGAKGDTFRQAVLSGNVQLDRAGPQAMQGTAGRVVMNFLAKNLLNTVHTEGSVKLVQHQKSTTPSSPAQDLEVTASAIDFFLAGGNRLDHAHTSGPAQIALRTTQGGARPQTVVTAGKFQARLRNLGRLASVHGAPNARITTSNPGQPDRISSSNTVDASFGASGALDSIVQQGAVAYVDGGRKAWAERARYTPADQMLVLVGAPRVVEQGMTTTANTLRLNRSTDRK